MKMYAEKRRNITRGRRIEIGDRVLLKRNTGRRKLEGAFHKEPYNVVKTKGSMIVSQGSAGDEKARNSSQVKVIKTDEPIVVESDDEDEGDGGDNPDTSDTPTVIDNHTDYTETPIVII